ncbi:MAG TPA: PqqD family peptide modification chaperone [Thermoanaerobaculia bacterium]
MKITPATIVVAAPDQLSTNVNGQVIIAGLRKGNYYALDSVGARVWELVQAPIATRELGRLIAEEYQVSEERCEADLLELLDSMARQGLLEVARAAVC